MLVFKIFLSWILLESAGYLAVVAGMPLTGTLNKHFAAYSSPVAMFDLQQGFKLIPGKQFDGLLIRESKLQFYYRDININNWGFRANKDYTQERGSVPRILVYGDSMTAGLYTKMPWPEILEEQLRADGVGAEVYNLSTDGGGVHNWTLHYNSKIKGKVDFDVLILAICCNSLRRSLVIYHSDLDGKNILYGRFSRLPEDINEFNAKYIPNMTPMFPLLDRKVIQDIATAYMGNDLWLRFKVIPFDFYVWRATLKTMKELPNNTKNYVTAKIKSAFGHDNYSAMKLRIAGIFKASSDSSISSSETSIKAQNKLSSKVQLSIFPEHGNDEDFSIQISQMVQDAKNRGARVIFLSLPHDKPQQVGHGQQFRFSEGDSQRYAEAVKKSANENDVTFINGYQAFDNITSQHVAKFWPSAEGHWLEEGMIHFVQWFAPQLAPLLKLSPSESYQSKEGTPNTLQSSHAGQNISPDRVQQAN